MVPTPRLVIPAKAGIQCLTHPTGAARGLLSTRRGRHDRADAGEHPTGAARGLLSTLLEDPAGNVPP